MKTTGNDKRTILNCLFVIVAFYALTTAIGLLAQTIHLVIHLAQYGTDGFGLHQVLSIIASVLCLAGVALFIVAVFTDKISDKILIYAQATIILGLLVVFGVALSDVTFGLPVTWTLQQAICLTILLAIYIYRSRQDRPVDDEEEELDA